MNTSKLTKQQTTMLATIRNNGSRIQFDVSPRAVNVARKLYDKGFAEYSIECRVLTVWLKS